MLRSLWFRLTGTVIFLVLFTLGLALVATLVIAGRQLSEFIDATSDEIIQITTPTELINGDVAIDENGIIIEDVDGTIVEVNPDGVVAVNPNINTNTNTNFEGDLAEAPFSQIDVQIPQIVQTQSEQLARDVLNTVLTAAGVSAFLALVAGTWLFWQITRPLARLRVAAEQVASGDLETRVSVRTKDEVGRVGIAFNQMASQLQRQEGLRKQMVADIAHELRTPLTVMQVNLEAMGDGLLDASPEELDGLHHEVTRLGRLVEDLRVLSLADAGRLQLYPAEMTVNELIKSAIRRLRPQAEDKGIKLVGTLMRPDLTIKADEDKLQQVLANLISNALRYTPAGAHVYVTAAATAKQVQITVRDEGPGVPPEQIDVLFERFYKGDKSRSRNESGSGLGLSIVKQIVASHGGTVSAALVPAGGLEISFTLPLT